MKVIKKQFLCCVALHKFNWESVELNKLNLDYSIQRTILSETVHNDLMKQHPLRKSYQQAFLRSLMSKIEESGNEVCDEIYIAYCELISKPNDESIQYRHIIIESEIETIVTIEESQQMILEGTTGLHSWQASLNLGEWCTEHKTWFQGKNVLELGCGIGLTGIYIIKTCHPKSFTFSDCNQKVLNTVCKNLKHNFPNVKNNSQSNQYQFNGEHRDTIIRIMEFNWEKKVENIPEFDVIIAADILYDKKSFNSLRITLESLLKNNDNHYVIIAATVRNEDTLNKFLQPLKNHNLSFQELDPLEQNSLPIEAIDAPVKFIKIFKIY